MSASVIEVSPLLPMDPEWNAAFPVLQQLRPDLTLDSFNQNFQISYERENQRYGAAFDANGKCEAVVGWRVMHKTVGNVLYIDDLVVDEQLRNRGIGRRVIQEMQSRATELGLLLALDTAREEAKAFYEKIGMTEAAVLFVAQKII